MAAHECTNARHCADDLSPVRPNFFSLWKLEARTLISTGLRHDFTEVMEILDERLNDKGKSWRHVFKVRSRDHFPFNSSCECQIRQSLVVLHYILHEGSDYVMLYFRQNSDIVGTLRYFEYIDEDGRDQGANVRQKAHEIMKFLMADESTSRRKPRLARSASDARYEKPYIRDEEDGYVRRRERGARLQDLEGAEERRSLEDRKRLLEWASVRMQEEEGEERVEALERARKKLEEEE